MSTELTKLILLPGMEGSGFFFKPLAEQLDERFDIEISAYPQDRPTSYEDLLPLVTERFPTDGPFIILGESYGGPLALMAASRAPINLLGVILVATFISSPVSRWLRWSAGTLCRPLLALRPKKTLMRMFLSGGCPEKTVKWVHSHMPALPADVIRKRLVDTFDVDVTHELTHCPAPILYIKPSDDRLVGKKNLGKILTVRSDVDTVQINAPHMVLQCSPEESAKVIVEWVEKIGKEVPE